MREQTIFQVLLLGVALCSALDSSKLQHTAISLHSGLSTNTTTTNGTYTFSYHRSTSESSVIESSTLTLSSADGTVTTSVQPTSQNYANSSRITTPRLVTAYPTAISSGFPVSSKISEDVKYPNTTIAKNATVTVSQPRISAQPFNVTLLNGTYAYAGRNLSLSGTTTAPKFRVAAAAASKAVFAHFMVGNTVHYSVADWQNDISLAQQAHIDGFALNIARGEATNAQSLADAFTAANSLGSSFKLMFSFDYAGRGSFGKDEVIGLINQYKNNPAYFYRGSQPMVSTFEGPSRSDDWADIKSATGCFFIPSWSSLGAKKAVLASGGVADGLFSWAAWPQGPNDMFTTVDQSYFDFLGGKTYMMPVSPWFFTNMPGYRKNWLWRGDDLWFDRWQQVHSIDPQPEYLEIVTWNDWGESHYIGPLRPLEYHAFDKENGKAPFNYAADMPHDGWREFLPYLIDTYKFGSAQITKEGVVAWYRLNSAGACGFGGTTGNTASQLQFVYNPALLDRDKIFYSALLTSSATVTVTIGGATVAGATWENVPSGGKGMYHGSVDFGNMVGTVTVTIRRGSTVVAAMTNGKPITSGCANGVQNWNAWVGSNSGGSISPVTVSQGTACIAGTGPGNYKILCELACKYDYCPPTCTCLAKGTLVEPPTALGINSCPKAGLDITYLGLCSFYCNRNSTCPTDLCTIVPKGTVCNPPPASDPFVPVCNAGDRADNVFGPLCRFTCSFGFCPPEICDCSQVGSSASTPPAISSPKGWSIAGEDFGLCEWACQRGNCPSDVCGNPSNGGSNKHISPRSATVIPFPATTVAATATFTIGGPVVSDIWRQPIGGNQNQPPGPDGCNTCDLMRLITSTCCGTGGGVSNPIQISPNTPIPRDIVLPVGFIPNQDVTDSQGRVWRAGSPLNTEGVIPTGYMFGFPFILPAGSSLTDKYSPDDDDDDDDDDKLHITSTFWTGPHTVTCSYPCIIVLPPLTTTTTWTPPPYTTITTGVTTTIPIPPFTTELVGLKSTTITSAPGSNPTKTFVPIPLPKPLCIKITLPILGTIQIGICPPKLDPFPPAIVIPTVTVVTGTKPGPTPVGNEETDDQQQQEEQEEEEDEEEEDPESCEWRGGDYNSDSSNWGFHFPLWLGPGNPMPPAESGGSSQVGAGTGVPNTSTVSVVITVTATATTRVDVTSTIFVPASPTQTPSQPSPTPNPNAPGPNPKTQKRQCDARLPQSYGAPIKRHIEAFCNLHNGAQIEAVGWFGATVWRDVYDEGKWVDQVGIHYLSTGNCRFTFSGSECKEIFSDITSHCLGNTRGFLATGMVRDNCGDYALTLGPKMNFDGGA